MIKREDLIFAFLFTMSATRLASAASTRAAPPAPATAAAPIPVTVWTWLLKIHSINYPADELTVDMYVVFTYDLKYRGKIDPMKHFEIVEAKNVTICEQDEEPRPEKGQYHQSFRCIAVIEHHWDIRSFPFDRHKIHFRIEDSMNKIGTLVHLEDPDSGRDEATIRDRDITDYAVSVGEHKWGWGDSFSAYEIAFTLKPRHEWGMFQKLFLTVFIALAVALLSFFVAPGDFNSRSGLLIGSLFAAIANQYVVSNSLPVAGTVTLVDTIHELTYSAILLCFALSLASYKCSEKRVDLSRRIDRWGFWAVVTAYSAGVTVAVAHAVAGG